MGHGIKKVVYGLIYLLLYAHTNTNGMLKKQFAMLDNLTKIDGSNHLPKTPPSPVSPVSPGSYKTPSNLIQKKKKLSNSSITTAPAKTEKAALKTMLNYWQSENDPLSTHKELDIYHTCIETLQYENKTFSCSDFIKYIKEQNMLLAANNKKRLPRVIAWAALDSWLSDKNISLEDIVNNRKGLLKKLSDNLGDYEFPARYLNKMGKLQQKNTTLFLSPNKKLFSTGNNCMYMQDVINPKNRQQLSVKTPKYSTTKIGNSIVFEPTGKFAVIYSPKGPITLWNITNTGTCIATLFDKPNEKRLIQKILVSNGCKRTLIYFSDGSYILRSIEPAELKNSMVIKTVTTGNFIQQAALSPDGKLVAIDTSNNILWVNDYSKNCKPDDNKTFPSCTKDTAIYSYVHTDKKISHLAFDPLSKYIAIITETLDKTDGVPQYHLIFCDLTRENNKNNQPILDWPLPESVSIMAFSAKGKYLALGYKNGFINICPVGKKETNPLQLDLTFGTITGLTFDQDETSLFASTTDGSVIILNVQSGEITGILKHKHAVVNGYFTNRWPLHGILAATNNRSIYQWGSKTSDVSVPTYLLLRYLPSYQVISLDNPKTAVENGVWMADKAQIESINSDLVKFECTFISVLVAKSEIIREKTEEEKNSELIATKKTTQLLWLSDQKNRLFLEPDGKFSTGISNILIDKNWFDPDGKNNINQ